MEHLYTGFKCTLCEEEFSISSMKQDSDFTTCPICGEKGILDVQYDYKKIKNYLTKETLAKNEDKSIWRYIHLLPVKDIPDKEMLKVGNTPLYKANRLSEFLGVKEFYIKDDGLNPTGSLKDRASIIAVAKALEEDIKTICCSSTGNAASSLAGNAAKAGVNTLIFVPERVPDGKLAQLIVYGSNVVKVQGDYKKAYDMSKLAIDTYGYYNRNAAINPYLVEGKKTVVYEICEDLDFNVPDWIVVSVGDGCSVGGVYKGLYDFKQIGLIDRIPKILGVQASGCNPFEEAFRTGEEMKIMDENTIADSIAVGIPRNPVKGMNAIINSNGKYVAVTDTEISEGKLLLGKYEGVFAEPASSASVAGYIKALKEGIIKGDESVVIINTGNGLKDTKGALINVEIPTPVEPNMEQLNLIVERMNKNGKS